MEVVFWAFCHATMRSRRIEGDYSGLTEALALQCERIQGTHDAVYRGSGCGGIGRDVNDP